MMGICLRYMNNEEDAKDILQDGFVKVFTQIESFQFKSSLYTWMSRIFVNLSINKLKRGVSYVQLEDDQELADTSMTELDAQPSWGTLTRDEVLMHVQELPDIYRVVLNMYAVDGLSHAEIADALDISVGSSKSRLSRARVILKERLNNLSNNA